MSLQKLHLKSRCKTIYAVSGYKYIHICFLLLRQEAYRSTGRTQNTRNNAVTEEFLSWDAGFVLATSCRENKTLNAKGYVH